MKDIDVKIEKGLRSVCVAEHADRGLCLQEVSQVVDVHIMCRITDAWETRQEPQMFALAMTKGLGREEW